jgi:hypothetical protein
MAYMSQEHKKEIAAVVKPILKKYKLKGSLSVQNHSTICLKIRSGAIDFFGSLVEPTDRDHMSVNHYWFKDHFKDGVAKDALKELIDALHGPRFFDESDAMTDYFHCSHYIDLDIGVYNKPYELIK